MTRHGVIQPYAEGAQPPAADPHAPVVIINADRTAPSCPPSQQYRAEVQRNVLSASIPALPDGGRAIADSSRKSKSP